VPRCYGSAAELAADPDVEAISVVNDERDHLDAVLAAVAARRPVLVEKPMTTRLEDARAMVDAAAAAGVILMPGHVLRFEPRLAALKEAVAAGQLGPIVSVHARRLLPVDRYAAYDRTHIVLNVGVHDIDLVLWLMDDEPIRVTALERNIQGGNTPDLVWSLIEFARGGIGVINLQWLVPERSGVFLESLTEVTGSAGMGSVRMPGDGLSLWGREGRSTPDTSLVTSIAGSASGALREELAYFARCVIRSEAPTWVTPGDGLRALELAMRVREAASPD
jgi:predicted dehydrogenase